MLNLYAFKERTNMQRDSYLYERRYFPQSGNLCDENITEWCEILGKTKLDKLIENYEELRGFLSVDNEYKVKKEYDDSAYRKIYKMFISTLYTKTKIDNEEKWKAKLFGPIYILFLRLAQYYGVMQYGMIIEQYFGRGIDESIYKAINPIIIRTLINEIHLCRDELIGDNENEKYQNYTNEYLENIEYIKDLFEYYPALLRCILDKIVDLIKFYYNLFKRWESDWPLIKAKLNINTDLIIKFAIVGDMHKCGQATVKIYLDGGECVYYKIRHMKISEIYNTIYSDICNYEGIQSGEYIILNRINYGWEREVQYKPCNCKEEVQRFYQRIGIHLLLNYMFDSQDLHYQNLIANGEYPFFVDVETICSTLERYSSSGGAYKNAIWNGESTIFKNGIIPFPNGKYNYFTAIEGKKGVETGLNTFKIVNPFTSNIEIENVRAITSKGHNLPYSGDVLYDWRDYFEFIVYGFSQAYQYVLSQKDDILKHLHQFEYRILLMNTFDYYNLLRLSYHPYFLTDGGNRQLFLSKIFMNHEKYGFENSKALFESEIMALLRNDIPYFYARSDMKDLFTNEGEKICANFLPIKPIDYLEERINKMSYEDMILQRNLLEVISPDYRKKNWSQYLYKPFAISEKGSYENTFRNLYLMIADRLLKSALIDKHKSDVEWIYATENGPYITDLYMYSGMAGIIIFYAALNKVENYSQYRRFEKTMIDIIMTYTDSADFSNVNTGALCGEYSIVYMYLMLYVIKRESKFLDYAKKHEEKIFLHIYNDKNYDLLYGNAGAILIYINMYKVTGESKYLYRAEYGAEYLIKQAMIQEDKIFWEKMKNVEGLAHGNSGIALSFIRLYQFTLKNKYLQNAIKCLNCEESMYNEYYQNWIDKEHEMIGSNRVAWCHGAAGIALVYKEALQFCTGDTYNIFKEKYEKAIETVEFNTRNHMYNLCLCHGIFGNCFILYCLADKQEEFILYMKKICKYVKQATINSEAPGFMNGLSGIGYILLEIDVLKDKLPNILKIDI